VLAGSGAFAGRGTVPTVIVHHDVRDKDHWFASPKREEVLGPLGVTNIRTFVHPQNRPKVAALMHVADVDAVRAAMETPAVARVPGPSVRGDNLPCALAHSATFGPR
jgi:hypothetical protein